MGKFAKRVVPFLLINWLLVGLMYFVLLKAASQMHNLGTGNLPAFFHDMPLVILLHGLVLSAGPATLAWLGRSKMAWGVWVVLWLGYLALSGTLVLVLSFGVMALALLLHGRSLTPVEQGSV